MIKGLLKKDLFNLRFYYILFAAVIFLTSTSLIGTLADESILSLIGYYLPIIFVGSILVESLILYSCQIDDKSNWERFIISNGVSRKNIVISKFVLSLINATFSGVFCLLFGIIFNPNLILYTLSAFVVIVSSAILSSSICYLLCIILGAIKGSVYLGLTYMLTSAIGPLIFFLSTYFFSNILISLAISFGASIILLTIALLIFYCCYKVICHKEY